ncbi:MAG: hypothetical protein AVDCRST_MAG91-1909 [uncultured Sphingomonadaceae bacterium]|uniref:Uncharacterized protein n=1 Tax=uncultured Sphingomonadaceae bacterium TaxID=169976 RepID=A0A6J4T7V3_9SPHN|nr:MAG: hypothetical protein AVDCRST_MAG91-1909 [uncultured Sphingomonadaceae bacterium]
MKKIFAAAVILVMYGSVAYAAASEAIYTVATACGMP